MTDLQIRRFEPDDAADAAASLRLLNAASAVDSPWEHPWPPRRFETMLRQGHDGEPPTAYLACAAGEAVASGLVFASDRDNRHVAWLVLAVVPEQRRRGFGTALFDHLTGEVRAVGRTSVGSFGWEGEQTTRFAEAVGLECRSRSIMRRQFLQEVDRAALDASYDEAARAAADYELVRITGRTPPGLVDAMVTLVAAINDAPTDDLDLEDEVFSAERLAAYEEASIAGGDRLYRLVARHRRTGDLGGHTVVGVEEDRPGYANQHDTAVARAHRGHRLGMLLKTGMLQWLVEAEPQLETLDTWNAESNQHMVAVNEALGYHVLGRELQFQVALPG
jgi:GNAT superfamily N-acetyltransferase